MWPRLWPVIAGRFILVLLTALTAACGGGGEGTGSDISANSGGSAQSGGAEAESSGASSEGSGGSAPVDSGAPTGGTSVGGAAGSHEGDAGAALGGSPASTGGADGVAGAQGGTPSGSGGSTEVSCAEEPVNLVLLVDSSGSMGDIVTPDESILNASLCWNPLHQALDAFLQSAEASELSASLTFFPARGNYETTCSLTVYEAPAVSLTSLGSPGALLSALDGVTTGGGSPTLPAIMASIAYAKRLETESAGSQSVVVLLTGGEPIVVDGTGEARFDACPPGTDNTIENIAAAAQAARTGSPSVPVYVIGFGEEALGMEPVAAAGGTEFYPVTGDTTEANAATALAALQEIRANETGCTR